MALDLTDYSSNTNDLTNVGATEGATTPFAASTVSANFASASSQYASIADASQTNLDLSTTFTIEFWAKFTSLPAISAIISKDSDEANAARSYLVYERGGGTLTVMANDGAGHMDLYDLNNTLPTGEWHHYAITCDTSQASATTFEFFIDATSTGNGNAVIANNISAIGNSTTPFALGARVISGTPTNFYDGLLDEVRIWNDIRTPTEISNNYQSELTGSEANLVAYYPFEVISSAGRTVIGQARVAATRTVAGARTVHPGRTAV